MKNIMGKTTLVVLFFAAAMSMSAQGKYDLLNSDFATVKYYNWDYGTEDGQTYGWLFSQPTGGMSPDATRQKIITSANSTGNDPNVPIADLPSGATSALRLGTTGYETTYGIDNQGNVTIESTEFAKGGGAAISFTVTQENALLFVNYATILTASLNDHYNTMVGLIGQQVYNPYTGGYSYIGDAALFEYPNDWQYQQPYVHMYLGVDGQELDCATRYQVLYDETGTPITLTNAWRSTSFDIPDGQVYYHYDAYYKPWAVMAIDLTPYIGHTVSFGAEYKDCAMAGYYFYEEDTNYDYAQIYTCDDHHLARLYMSISCSPAGDGITVESPLQITAENCKTRQISLQAPEGFASYQWYASTNPSQVLSSTQTCNYSFPSGAKEAYIYCKVTSNMTLGCTYETTTLQLYLENTCTCESEITVPENVCADAEKIVIDMNYTTGEPTSFDVVFDEIAQAQGFQNITGQTILNPKKIEIPMPQPETGYIRPDRYNATLVIHQSCDEDKVVPFGFYVLYPSSVIVQKWSDVMAVKNATNNGGYTFSAIRWYRNGENIPGQGNTGSYIYVYPSTFSIGDQYWAELTRADDGKTFCTCPINIEQPETAMPEREQKIIITAEQDLLHISAVSAGEYVIYDMTGQVAGRGSFEAGDRTITLHPAATGTYLICFTLADGTRETRKVFIY